MDPHARDAYYYLGMSYSQAGNTKKAGEVLEKANRRP
jgi:TolA-binding protein